MFTHIHRSMERVVRVICVSEHRFKIQFKQQTLKGVSIEKLLQIKGCRTS